MAVKAAHCGVGVGVGEADVVNVAYKDQLTVSFVALVRSNVFGKKGPKVSP